MYIQRTKKKIALEFLMFAREPNRNLKKTKKNAKMLSTHS